MNLNQRIQLIRTGFSSTFWIANTLELFERLAYYGSKAILTVYLANKVGLNEEAGFLAGIFNLVLYSLPIVAGVFVDKYGFRKTLTACFIFFCIGYFLIGMAGLEFGQDVVNLFGKRNYVLAVLLLTAIGGSLIKPCIVGTVTKTSSPDSRALGFSIYYTLVNLGGAIGPMIALQVREEWGIEYVLIMSSITSLLLIVGTLLFFKEPDTQAVNEEVRTFRKVFSDMILVFGNLKFMTFLLIFSGFWMMFWQIFYSFPFYITDILKFERFELLETVDAWCIIILTVPVTALVSKWKPITAMTLGFIISSLSWVIIGFWQSIAASIIGIAFFALGEATQAPRFYEYVSSLAPKNQVGTFMGFSFLPVAIGSFTAGIIADWLRISYLNTNPSMMWYSLAGIGLVSTLLMIIYNLIVSKSST
ncbi:MAG: MFS transporter [Cyclobacteriaceae bacterium]|jgi:dipeptide/tripeptide permease|nr:MFS transporter [Cyclobacteriaceae bacterium]